MATAVEHGCAFAVVANIDRYCGSLEAEDDLGGSGAAPVLERVGQRLLDDPIDRQIDPGLQSALLAVYLEGDWKSCCTHLLDERPQFGSARLRRELESLAFAEHPEKTRHLPERLPPRPLDRHQLVACPRGFGVEHSVGRLRVQHHHRHGMRDHVVKVSRDPCPLISHCRAGRLLPVALEQRRTQFKRLGSPFRR